MLATTGLAILAAMLAATLATAEAQVYAIPDTAATSASHPGGRTGSFPASDYSDYHRLRLGPVRTSRRRPRRKSPSETRHAG